jgi:DNA polymerase III epsilon subunit-like protein
MTAPGNDGPATPGAALDALWASLRLVVVDVETLLADGTSRLIEVAVATCRRGEVTSSWSARVNPGLPVDEQTLRVHGITTEELTDEPSFDAVEPELTRRLRGVDGEQVVLVAHNAGTDIGVLKREYKLLGQALPDLPVLDTMYLPKAVGVRPASRSLADLLTELGLSNPKAHSAAGDARATADATLAMLRRAAEYGWADFDALRAKAMERRAGTTGTIRGPGKRKQADADEFEVDLDFPMEHTREHGRLLDSADPAVVLAWQVALTECAQLRCSYANDRVSEADVPAADVLCAVETVLDALLAPAEAEVDVPAVATVVGTIEPLLAALPDRSAALAWHDRWLPRLRTVGRCNRAEKSTPCCPACRRGASCPLDIWPGYVAPAAVGTLTKGSLKSFLHLTGADTGRGVLTTWLGKDRRLLTEAAAWLVHQQHRAAGQDVAAQSFARLAYVAGAREPRLMAAYANLLAAPGSEADLHRAVDACDEALLSRGGSTFEGWTELGAKRGQLLGRLERLRVRPTDQLDEDGNPIPVRRHHPEAPRRTRPRRFQVGG